MSENNVIRIPGTESIEAEEFFDERLYIALAKCQAGNKQAMFVPEIADARIILPSDNRIWKIVYSTPSIRVTGKTERGKNIEIFGHITNYFCMPKNIKKSIDGGLLNGAGEVPEEEFLGLLDSEDEKNVFIRDKSVFIWPNGTYGISAPSQEHMKEYGGKINGIDMIAINNPMIIPFLGGKERAEAYLKKHEQVKGKEIRIWYSDDQDVLFKHKQMGRVLFFDEEGSLSDDCWGYGLANFGRFIGGKNLESIAETAKKYILQERLK